MKYYFEKKTERLYSLDFIRIVATVCIVFHHYQQMSGLKFDRGINFYFGSFYFGNLVELFFVLSGFLIVYKTINKTESFKDFFLRRYLRLIPLVVLSVIVYEILIIFRRVVLDDTRLNVDIWGSIITALGVQAWGVFNNPAINNPVWYISVLLLCYSLYYFVIWVSKKLNVSPVYFFILLCLIGCSIVVQNYNFPFFNNGVGRGLYSFFWSAALAAFLDKHIISRHITLVLSILIVIISIMIAVNCEWIKNGLGFILTFVLYPLY